MVGVSNGDQDDTPLCIGVELHDAKPKTGADLLDDALGLAFTRGELEGHHLMTIVDITVVLKFQDKDSMLVRKMGVFFCVND
jgi:hypothetical protein